jgi:hypothetical protein
LVCVRSGFGNTAAETADVELTVFFGNVAEFPEAVASLIAAGIDIADAFRIGSLFTLTGIRFEGKVLIRTEGTRFPIRHDYVYSRHRRIRALNRTDSTIAMDSHNYDDGYNREENNDKNDTCHDQTFIHLFLVR